LTAWVAINFSRRTELHGVRVVSGHIYGQGTGYPDVPSIPPGKYWDSILK